jgi:hypothetical protein
MQNDPEPGKLWWQDTPDEQDSLAKRKINCHGTSGRTCAVGTLIIAGEF